MDNLLNSRAVMDRLALERRVFFFFDFDGTLAPIVRSPRLASLSGAVRQLLVRLVATDGVRVGVISGRPLVDIRRRIGIRGIWHAGSHGTELLVNGKQIRQSLPERHQHELARLSRTLKKELAQIPGLVWERKPGSLAVHYRNVHPKRTKAVENVLRGALASAKGSMMSLRPCEGKKVVEFIPCEAWDKGSAVVMMLKASDWGEGLAVYFGDDVTDESAFAVVRANGITVRVGDPRAMSLARYYLRSPADVRKLLALTVKGRQKLQEEG